MKYLFSVFCLFITITSLSQDPRHLFVDSLLSGVEVKKDIRYNTCERPLLLDVYTPNEIADEKLPCIVWIHGGGLTNASMDKTDDGTRWGVARIALSGYVTVSINYRLLTERPLPVAMQDCMTAIRFLKSNAEQYGIDTTRMAVAGESAGGYLAGMCAYTCNTGIFSTREWNNVSNDFVCGVLWYPPMNYWPYNMLDYVSPDDIPVISVHGDEDVLVPIQDSYQLREKCLEKELDFQLHVIEGANHGFYDNQWKFNEKYREYMEMAIEITIDFLDRNLKNK